MLEFLQPDVYPVELCNADLDRFTLECRVKSLEAKLERVEPFSEDFDETMALLISARRDLLTAGMEAQMLRYKQMDLENRRKMAEARQPDQD